MSQRRRRTLRQRIDAIAGELEPRARDAFLRATRDVTNRAQLGRIVRALETGDAEAALRAIGLDPGAYTDLTEELRAAFVRGGQATTTLMPTLFAADGSRLTVRFDPRNPQAEAWLRDYSSTLVTRIVDDQRQAIRQSLDAGMQAGRNPRSVALDIIGRVNPQSGRREGGIVGLTAQQERFARNAADELLSGDPTRMSSYFERERRDRRFDRLVARAIREGRPLTQAEADKVLGRYRDRLLLLRGETIARTEMLASLNASQRQAYEQAISEGAVERQNVVKVWRTARDARVRDTHRWISGQERAMDERFGNGLMYPGEPGAPAAEVINCRCTVEHRIDFIAQNLGAEPTGPRPDSETGTGTDGPPQPRQGRPPRPVTVPPSRVPSPPALPTGEAIAPQPPTGDLPPVPVPTSSPDLTGIVNIDALEQNALLRLGGAGFTAEQWGDVFSPHIRPEAPETLFKRAVAVDESSVVFQGATDKTKVTRTLNLETGVAKHTVLELDPQSQGQGLGKRILKESVAAYRRMGMSRVELSANIDVGGYAWAKYGFVPDEASWRKLRAELSRRLLRASVPDDVKLAVGKLLGSDDPRMIWRIADLQVKNRSGVNLGKALLLGTSWRGTLDLRDAESMERFDAYVAR